MGMTTAALVTFVTAAGGRECQPVPWEAAECSVVPNGESRLAGMTTAALVTFAAAGCQFGRVQSLIRLTFYSLKSLVDLQ